jgi:hypothetical protein
VITQPEREGCFMLFWTIYIQLCAAMVCSAKLLHVTVSQGLDVHPSATVIMRERPNSQSSIGLVYILQ